MVVDGLCGTREKEGIGICRPAFTNPSLLRFRERKILPDPQKKDKGRRKREKRRDAVPANGKGYVPLPSFLSLATARLLLGRKKRIRKPPFSRGGRCALREGGLLARFRTSSIKREGLSFSSRVYYKYLKYFDGQKGSCGYCGCLSVDARSAGKGLTGMKKPVPKGTGGKGYQQLSTDLCTFQLFL